jgi:hypothetical protein
MGVHFWLDPKMDQTSEATHEVKKITPVKKMPDLGHQRSPISGHAEILQTRSWQSEIA